MIFNSYFRIKHVITDNFEILTIQIKLSLMYVFTYLSKHVKIPAAEDSEQSNTYEIFSLIAATLFLSNKTSGAPESPLR